MSRIFSIALGVLFSAGLCNQGTARAGEVKLLSALVMKPALAELAASFELTSGHKPAITYDSAGAVTKRIQFGEAADVAIIQRPCLTPGHRLDLAPPTTSTGPIGRIPALAHNSMHAYQTDVGRAVAAWLIAIFCYFCKATVYFCLL